PGLLLAMRVMFFGVRRQVDAEHTTLRRWPLALASLLTVIGVSLYFRARNGGPVGIAWTFAALGFGLLAAAGAWAAIQYSANAPSTDPEDDPQFRFQGQVARLVEGIEPRGGQPP